MGLARLEAPVHSCHRQICPAGRMFGVCGEPSHWTSERQHYGSVSSTRPNMTLAHLLQTAGYNLGHAITHLDAAMKPKSPADQQFNLEHCQHHLDEVQDHLGRAIEQIQKHFPGLAKELDEVVKAEVIGYGGPGEK